MSTWKQPADQTAGDVEDGMQPSVSNGAVIGHTDEDEDPPLAMHIGAAEPDDTYELEPVV